MLVVGAPKSGKTTLSEMLFEAGLITVAALSKRTPISDYHEIERRGNSVYATSMHTEWKDYKINIIDTPGLRRASSVRSSLHCGSPIRR